jgi:hypothetical protein
MEETYYFITVYGGTEITRSEEFPSEEARDDAARREWNEVVDPLVDNIFWLNIEDGEPFIGSYTLGELDYTKE